MVFRWIIYYLILFISYIIISTVKTGLPVPLLMIPFSLCIAMYEHPFSAAVTGLVAGMLLDTALGTIIGLNGIILMWCCLITSLLFMFIMKRHFVNILGITIIVSFVQCTIHYFFYYSIWDYNSGGDIYVREFLPVIAMTNVFTVLFYYLIRFLVNKVGIIRENYIEEKTDDIVRE